MKHHTNDEIMEIGDKFRFLSWMNQESTPTPRNGEEAKKVVQRWMKCRDAERAEMARNIIANNKADV